MNNDYKKGKNINTNYSNKKTSEIKQNAHLITVKKVKRITPNMLRVTFYCPSLKEMDSSRQGAHCKILLPKPKTSLGDFKEIISIKPKDLRIDERPIRRTYTVRFFRKESMEMDIDFVDHGDGVQLVLGHEMQSGEVLLGSWVQHFQRLRNSMQTGI
tara:strand:+ start:88 stop:558 length:471 start_codon:yes stop_codon:yes gene_type:complete